MDGERHSTVRRILRLNARAVLLSMFACSAVFAAFYWGRLSGMGAAADLRERNKDLASHVNQQAIELRGRKAAQVRVEKAAEVDRIAAEVVRRDLLTYRQETADLQRDVDFFRGLMAPDELQRGLKLHSFDLDFDESSDRYSFKAVMTNAGGKGNVIKGSLSLKLIAAKNGSNREFIFSELPEFQGSMPVKLRFRFFQNIQVRLKRLYLDLKT